MHTWQNGTRCRDGVKVLWCRSHLVWLVFDFNFEGSIPTCMQLSSFRKLFVTCSCVFFLRWGHYLRTSLNSFLQNDM